MLAGTACAVVAMGLVACGGAGGGPSGGGGGDAVRVPMVNNPQMVDLQKLTVDNFTKETGIKVEFTVPPENDLRDKASQEFSSQASQYDVATLSNFEIPPITIVDRLAEDLQRRAREGWDGVHREPGAVRRPGRRRTVP